MQIRRRILFGIKVFFSVLPTKWWPIILAHKLEHYFYLSRVLYDSDTRTGCNEKVLEKVPPNLQSFYWGVTVYIDQCFYTGGPRPTFGFLILY